MTYSLSAEALAEGDRREATTIGRTGLAYQYQNGILSICISTMPYGNYIYELLLVIDRVDNAINSDPNSPQVSCALQLNTVVMS